MSQQGGWAAHMFSFRILGRLREALCLMPHSPAAKGTCFLLRICNNIPLDILFRSILRVIYSNMSHICMHGALILSACQNAEYISEIHEHGNERQAPSNSMWCGYYSIHRSSHSNTSRHHACIRNVPLFAMTTRRS